MTEDSQYTLLDSGSGRKLEQFGPYILDRPASQAMWEPQKPRKAWKAAHASFTREGANQWEGRNALPQDWQVVIDGIKFKLQATDFGHLGVFPEQQVMWKWISQQVEARRKKNKPVEVLNLFAYSGGSTLAAARAGASVCHLDASKGMVTWARENAVANGLGDANIRWIADDASKFVERELRRGRRYEGIILDPPTFGRGNRGELFKIEEHLLPLLHQCRKLLSDDPLFVLFSCHTPGMTPIVMSQLLQQILKGCHGTTDCGEMTLPGKGVFSLPSGTYARWTHG